MSTLFTKVEGEQAVVSSNGVYRQCDLYTRMGSLYAKVGPGFVRLYANGGTSQPKTKLDSLEWDGALFKDSLGRLRVEAGDKTTPLQIDGDGQLQLEGPKT